MTYFLLTKFEQPLQILLWAPLTSYLDGAMRSVATVRAKLEQRPQAGLYTLLFFFYVSARQLPSRLWHSTRCEKSRSRSPSDLPEPTPGKQSDVRLEAKRVGVHKSRLSH